MFHVNTNQSLRLPDAWEEEVLPEKPQQEIIELVSAPRDLSEILSPFHLECINNLKEFNSVVAPHDKKIRTIQRDTLLQCAQGWEKGDINLVVNYPTGLGKTYLFTRLTAVCMAALRKQQKQVLIVVPKTNLLKQTMQSFKQYAPDLKFAYFDPKKDQHECDVIVTTYQKLDRCYESVDFSRFGMIHLDEAHKSLSKNRATIVQTMQVGKPFLFGYTATPVYNTSRENKLSTVYQLMGYTKPEDNPIQSISIEEGIENKFLAPVQNIILKPKITGDHRTVLKKLQKQTAKKGIDINENTIGRIINKREYNLIAVDFYLNQIDPQTQNRFLGQSCVVFAAGIEHANSVADLFNEIITSHSDIYDFLKRQSDISVSKKIKNKYPFKIAAAVHSNINSTECEKIIKAYKKGRVLVLVGADKLTEGFDKQGASLEINLRPTRSRVIVIQRGGRVIRIDPQDPNKIATIVDFVWEGLFNMLLFTDCLNGKMRLGELPIIEKPSATNTLPTHKVDATTYEIITERNKLFSMPERRNKKFLFQKRFSDKNEANSNIAEGCTTLLKSLTDLEKKISVFSTRLLDVEGIEVSESTKQNKKRKRIVDATASEFVETENSLDTDMTPEELALIAQTQQAAQKTYERLSRILNILRDQWQVEGTGDEDDYEQNVQQAKDDDDQARDKTQNDRVKKMISRLRFMQTKFETLLSGLNAAAGIKNLAKRRNVEIETDTSQLEDLASELALVAENIKEACENFDETAQQKIIERALAAELERTVERKEKPAEVPPAIILEPNKTNEISVSPNPTIVTAEEIKEYAEHCRKIFPILGNLPKWLKEKGRLPTYNETVIDQSIYNIKVIGNLVGANLDFANLQAVSLPNDLTGVTLANTILIGVDLTSTTLVRTRISPNTIFIRAIDYQKNRRVKHEQKGIYSLRQLWNTFSDNTFSVNLINDSPLNRYWLQIAKNLIEEKYRDSLNVPITFNSEFDREAVENFKRYFSESQINFAELLHEDSQRSEQPIEPASDQPLPLQEITVTQVLSNGLQLVSEPPLFFDPNKNYGRFVSKNELEEYAKHCRRIFPNNTSLSAWLNVYGTSLKIVGNFSNIDLSYTNLKELTIIDVNFSNANLQGASLPNHVFGVNFQDANLIGVLNNPPYLSQDNFRGAIIIGGSSTTQQPGALHYVEGVFYKYIQNKDHDKKKAFFYIKLAKNLIDEKTLRYDGTFITLENILAKPKNLTSLRQNIYQAWEEVITNSKSSAPSNVMQVLNEPKGKSPVNDNKQSRTVHYDELKKYAEYCREIFPHKASLAKWLNVNGTSLRLVGSFSGEDLSYTNLSELDLNGVNFSNANLQGASFPSVLKNVDFRKANLIGALLQSHTTVTLLGCNFNEAILIGTTVYGGFYNLKNNVAIQNLVALYDWYFKVNSTDFERASYYLQIAKNILEGKIKDYKGSIITLTALITDPKVGGPQSYKAIDKFRKLIYHPTNNQEINMTEQEVQAGFISSSSALSNLGFFAEPNSPPVLSEVPVDLQKTNSLDDWFWQA